MKIYKSEHFKSGLALTEFLNEKGIAKEDIIFITRTDYWFDLFYYTEE